MIGQTSLLEQIATFVENKNVPRFIIIAGPEGSGKKLLAQEICTLANFFWCYESDNKINTVRNVITDAYKVTVPTCYVFTDSDTMSLAAKNALLKITEEPPNNAYIIMTVCNASSMLGTLLSRAVIFNMEAYSPEELVTYAHDIKDDVDDDMVAQLCETPGDVNLLLNDANKDLYDYVIKVVDNVEKVSLANALKIAEKIGFKGESGKYDIKLFLKIFKMECGKRFVQSTMETHNNEDKIKYTTGVKVATYFLNQLNITGINKAALFDIFILDIRREWA